MTMSRDSARPDTGGRGADVRAKRRAGAVPLALGGVFVASLTALAACSSGDGSAERCVDMRTNTVIDDKYCEDTSTATSYAHWYVGGSGFKLGSKVSGGEEGEHGVVRGGFGGHGDAGGDAGHAGG